MPRWKEKLGTDWAAWYPPLVQEDIDAEGSNKTHDPGLSKLKCIFYISSLTWVGSHNPHEKPGVVVCSCNPHCSYGEMGEWKQNYLESHKPVSLDCTAWRPWNKTLAYRGADGRGVWPGGGESSTPEGQQCSLMLMSLLGRSQFSLWFVAAVGGDI